MRTHDTSPECVHGGDGGYASAETFGEEGAMDTMAETSEIRDCDDTPEPLGYEAATQIVACNMMGETALEGVQAFIDKRQQALGVSH
jgi:hypothetical protein